MADWPTFFQLPHFHYLPGFDEGNAVVASDGRWLAYESNESGQYQIYVRPFPAVDTGRWQV